MEQITTRFRMPWVSVVALREKYNAFDSGSALFNEYGVKITHISFALSTRMYSFNIVFDSNEEILLFVLKSGAELVNNVA